MRRDPLVMQPRHTTPGKSKWLKRIGIWGFLFFLVKGLVWVGIAVWGWWMAS